MHSTSTSALSLAIPGISRLARSRRSWRVSTGAAALVFGVGLLVGCTSVVNDTEDTAGTDGTSGSDGTDGVAGNPDGLSFRSAGNVVTLTWPEEHAGSGRVLAMTQGATEVWFDVPDGQAMLAIPGDVTLAQLSDFVEGEATWTLLDGDTTLATGTVTLVERFTSFFQVGAAEPLPLEGLDGPIAVGTSVVVNANSGPTGIRPKVYIGRPSGPVDIITLGDSNLPANDAFMFEYQFAEPGVYAVEINLTNGLPGVNVGVYVGNGLPMVRGVLDVPVTAEHQLPPPLDVPGISARVLELVNALRSSLGVDALVSHPGLEATALQKAEDMATRQYFAHTDPDGKGAKDLVLAAGLTGFVAENIAIDYNPDRVFAAWYWSPSHRVSLLDPAMKSHGLGVATFNAQYNQLSFAQHFLSTLPE